MHRFGFRGLTGVKYLEKVGQKMGTFEQARNARKSFSRSRDASRFLPYFPKKSLLSRRIYSPNARFFLFLNIVFLNIILLFFLLFIFVNIIFLKYYFIYY